MTMLFAETAAKRGHRRARRARRRPGRGVDAVLDVRVDDGVIAELGSEPRRERPPRRRGEGLVLAPAFVDPHVHLRTPGREDEEDHRLRHARRGRRRLLRDPRDAEHRPGRRLGSGARLARRARARPRRRSRSASSPRSREGQEGDELTEMVELAEPGAAGFTDDGRPVVSPGLLRRALQYTAAPGGRSRCTARSRRSRAAATMHEGAVSAELGFGG